MQSRTSAVPILGIATIVFYALSMAHAAPHPDRGANEHPAYEVKGPVLEPRLFAEGVVSTVDDEIGGSFSPDGSDFYFTRLVPYTTFPRLGIMCVSHYADGHWNTPEALSFSGKNLDYPPRLNSSGQRMLFASSRPLPDGTRGGIRIWEVERTASGWGEPRPLPPPVNPDGSHWSADPSVADDGTLYFSSDRDGPGSVHIYRSRFADGKYSEPEKLGPEINSEFNDYSPYISPDGKILIFASSGSGVPPFTHRPKEIMGGGKPYPRADLYISFNQSGKWTPARHLEHGINTEAEEQYPFLTPDGRYLFFSSERSPFTVPVAHRLDYRELETDLHSTLNGHGNVFFIGVETLELPK
jgi:hypothetical protein